MRWPGRIPAGRICDELVSTIDLLPTVCGLLDVPLPQHPIDGKDIASVVFGVPGAVSPHDAFYCYAGNELQAVRSGRWKLHLPHEYLTVNGPPGRGGKPANWETMKPLSITESGIRGIASRHGYKVESIGLSLFDLSADPGETTNVADKHPDVVAKLLEHAEAARVELGDSLTQRVGRGIRPVGRAVEAR
jgi:arylsulfatase